MNSILKITVTDSHLKAAKKIYNKLPKDVRENGYNNKSYRNGNFLLQSIICEVIVSECLGEEAKIKSTRDYDIICNGDCLDVKSKPNSDKEPQPYWNASIPAYQVKMQDCHGYVFARINRDMSVVWITGIISKDDFKEHSRYAKAGSKDGKWKWEVSSYYIKLNKLHPLSLYKEGKYKL